MEPVDRVWGVLALMPPRMKTRVMNEAGIKESYSILGRKKYWIIYVKFSMWLIQEDQDSPEIDVLLLLSLAPLQSVQESCLRGVPIEMPSRNI